MSKNAKLTAEEGTTSALVKDGKPYLDWLKVCETRTAVAVLSRVAFETYRVDSGQMNNQAELGMMLTWTEA